MLYERDVIGYTGKKTFLVMRYNMQVSNLKVWRRLVLQVDKEMTTKKCFKIKFAWIEQGEAFLSFENTTDTKGTMPLPIGRIQKVLRSTSYSLI